MMESQIARNKGDDIRDISVRLRNALAGVTLHPLEAIPPGCVLVASRLLPSDIVFLAGRSAAAVMLEYGSTGSHAALFAREMGLPCISGLANLMDTATPGALALVDADAGTVRILPRRSQQVAFRHKAKDKARIIRLAHKHARKPAVTKDGVTIAVLANVGGPGDTAQAMANGADGVGLYRMERAYMGCVTPPTPEELLNEMRHTLQAAKGRPVCVRLLDLGADKPMPFIRFLAETNPALGRRGIRLLREYPELLKAHLRAVLALAREFDVQVLVPMVSTPEDMAVVKENLRQLGVECQAAVLPPVGAMIETPAAALSAREIARHADFLSFGTNDLTQYTFAADRGNARVANVGDPLHPAVLRQIGRVIDAAHAAGKWVGLCGELAGRPEGIPVLLGLGLDEFSMSAASIPAAKALLARLNVTDAQQLAQQVLNLPDADVVKAEVKRFVERLAA
jgi:phosphoenolpyruvate-protein phosphotransferase